MTPEQCERLWLAFPGARPSQPYIDRNLERKAILRISFNSYAVGCDWIDSETGAVVPYLEGSDLHYGRALCIAALVAWACAEEGSWP